MWCSFFGCWRECVCVCAVHVGALIVALLSTRAVHPKSWTNILAAMTCAVTQMTYSNLSLSYSWHLNIILTWKYEINTRITSSYFNDHFKYSHCVCSLIVRTWVVYASQPITHILKNTHIYTRIYAHNLLNSYQRYLICQ